MTHANAAVHDRARKEGVVRSAEPIRERLARVLPGSEGRQLRSVTVGETDAFLDQGGMIALTADRNRVRLHINPSLLRAANLDVSSKLLRVAQIKP